GEWARAAEEFEHATTIYRSRNVLLQLSLAVSASAYVLARLGEAAEARSRLEECEQLIERRTRPTVFLGAVYSPMGRACLVLGRLDASQRLGERAVELTSRQPGTRAGALLLLGDCSTLSDRFDAERSEAHYRGALALAEPRGMRPLVAACHLGLGKLYRRT